MNHCRELEFEVARVVPFPSQAIMHTTVANAFMDELLGTVTAASDHGPTTVVSHAQCVRLSYARL